MSIFNKRREKVGEKILIIQMHLLHIQKKSLYREYNYGYNINKINMNRFCWCDFRKKNDEHIKYLCIV